MAPNNADWWHVKALALYRCRRPTEAIDDFRRAVSINPELSEAWSSMAIALNELELSDEAIAPAKRVTDLKPDDV